MTRLADHQALYVRSMRKALRVTAIFTDDSEANAHMAKHPDDAVVACFGPFIFLASRRDKGADITREEGEHA